MKQSAWIIALSAVLTAGSASAQNPTIAELERQLQAKEAEQAAQRRRAAEAAEARRRAEAEAEEARRRAEAEAEEARRRAEAEAEAARTRPGTVFRDALTSGGEGPAMVVLAAGSFVMGSPAGEPGRSDHEGPQRTVQIKSFAMGQAEVTFADWRLCVERGGCVHRPSDEGWGMGDQPVINVSWEDASQYAEWLSRETGRRYRLPSEAEWEYAARAGTTTAYSWGEAIGQNRANCRGCGSAWDGRQAAPVRSFGANPWGLYDLHGNVWEWVQDCYSESYAWAPTDGSAVQSGDCGFRVLRGGSWNYFPAWLRSADRGSFHSADRRADGGFRLARTL
jgi:formylglycine-generating enzyme required for sulfatase activity